MDKELLEDNTPKDVKSIQIGDRLVVYINGAQYQKVFKDADVLAQASELALKVDPENEEEVEALKAILTHDVPETVQKEIDRLAKLKAEYKKYETINDWLQGEVVNIPELELKEESLFIKGINIPMPDFIVEDLVERYQSGIQEDIDSLLNFWRLLALNKDPKCREDLYKFLCNHKMALTPAGYFVAYRNVSVVKDSVTDDLRDYVELMYTKILGWKKSPKNYVIYSRDGGDDEDERVFKAVDIRSGKTMAKEWTNEGELMTLYNQYTAENTQSTYTDNHTRTMEIKVGTPVRIPRNECDSNPDRTCSNGLHLGSPGFMRQGDFGQVGLVCICNPMNVVAVPYAGGEKLRCCEYMPVGQAEYDENDRIIPIDISTLEIDYQEYTTKEIDEMLSSCKFEYLVKHTIIPKEISEESLKAIKASQKVKLKDMTALVNKRVVEI